MAASLLIIATAGAGILLASYIHAKKRAHRVMVCPLHSNCEVVTHSEFSRFLGVPVELLGIMYYTLIVAVYSLFLVVPTLATMQTVFVAFLITTAAVMFSAYLTFIQAFTLRQWCTWCLLSAGLCLVIFLTALNTADYNFTELLARNYRLIRTLHLLGIAFGLAGATITDLLFFKFLKDFRISAEESGIMRTLSQVIWVGIAILILSGLGLYLPEAARLNESSKFLLKVVVVAVIVVNGAFLNLYMAPKFINISFSGPLRPGERAHWRKIAFALGSISATSWYTAFILGSLRSIPLSFPVLLMAYLCLLGGAITSSQIIGARLVRSAH